MFARALTLTSLLLIAGPPLDASAQAPIELDVQLLDVDADAMRLLDPKPAVDAIVRGRSKGLASTIGVARYQSLGLRLGLVRQRPGVRVVQAPHIHAIQGAPYSLAPNSPMANPEETPEVVVTSQRLEDGRVALNIELTSQHSVVRVVVNEGESVMVSGLETPPSGWPGEAPLLGDEEHPRRARLLFVTVRSSVHR